MTAQEEARRARVAHDDGVRRLRDAMMTGGEEAVIAVFESEPGLAGMCPPDGVTMLHRAAQWPPAGGDMAARPRGRREQAVAA